MKNLIFVLSLVLAAATATATVTASTARAATIGDLKTSSNAYFFKTPNPYARAAEFVVRADRQAIGIDEGEPVYLKNRVCKLQAYVHLFSFGQTPSNLLSKGTEYALLHVRRDPFYQDDEDEAEIRVALGSYYANPRVLIATCHLSKTDSVERLKAALQNLFEIR